MQYQPIEYTTVDDWCANQGAGLLSNPKLLSYHAKPLYPELVQCGAIAMVGSRIYLHKELFWSEFQKAQAAAKFALDNYQA